VLGLMSMCGTTRTDAAGAHTRSPTSWTTRGEDHPTARLNGPGPRKVWHRVQELAGRARLRLPRGDANRDLHRAAQSQDSAHWPYIDLMDTLIMA